ncbi:MAG: branched-chain amino acid ABC transporter permease [Deltaproteobacteria bacterium]|nr:branched-chain amino acid ABC transporter permease [Deltaproteobacteria bacterium]
MKRHLVWLAAALAGLLAFPLVADTLQINLMVRLAIEALFAVSLNLLLSFTGLLSFGHALYFGVGAYGAALLLTHLEGIPLLVAVLLSGLAAALVALVLSPLLVRVRATAFAMLTLAFGQLMFVLCSKFRGITGGEDGIMGWTTPPLRVPGLFSLDVTQSVNIYFFAVGLACLGIGAMWYFTKTPMGSVMVSIRDNQKRVDYLGFQVVLTKAVIFCVSGFFAGLAGALYAVFNNLVSVGGVLNIMVSFQPLMAILVGGIGTFFGPILGSGVLLFLEELIQAYPDLAQMINGLIFILVVMFLPGGAISFGSRLRGWRQKRAYLKKARESAA